MLIEFRVENFRSIRSQTSISLEASNKERRHSPLLIAPELPGLKGATFNRGAVIYGANAAGKSNIIKAVQALKNLVVDSSSRSNPGDPMLYDPFLLDDSSRHLPTYYEISFVVEGCRYLYGLEHNRTRVLEEFLVAYPKGLGQKWFHRTFKSNTGEYVWQFSEEYRSPKNIKNVTRENVLFLSTAASFNSSQIRPIYSWFKDCLIVLSLGAHSVLNPLPSVSLLESESGKAKVLDWLAKADLAISHVEKHDIDISIDSFANDVGQEEAARILKSKEGVSVQQSIIEFFHFGEEGRAYPIDIRQESNGTQRFFSLIAPFLRTEKASTVLFIDEIETSLHPLLVKLLVEEVLNRSAGSQSSQLVLATHSSFLIQTDFLRRDQVWLADKNLKGETMLTRLTAFKTRSDESIGRGYLSGRYGGVPLLNGLGV